MKTRQSLAVMLLLLVTACGDDSTPGNSNAGTTDGNKTSAKTYADSTDGLKSYMDDLSAAATGDDAAKATPLAEGLIYKDAERWFKKTFGDEQGAALTKEYANTTKSGAAGLVGMLKAQKAKNRTEFIVERFEKSDDMNASGYQETALKAAKTPLVIYSWRAVEPGRKSGQHLFNFVHLDGQWRFVGPMKMIKPPTNAEMDAVASMRAKDREEFFKSGKLPE